MKDELRRPMTLLVKAAIPKKLQRRDLQTFFQAERDLEVSIG